jgi:Ca2+-binding EF-hand superfamily protein
MDFDNTGLVHYSEFIASFIDATLIRNEKLLRSEFLKLDVDRDGKLKRSDIEQIVHSDSLSVGLE